MKNIYYYMYYKIYRNFEHSSMPWWSDMKAGFILATIEMFILALLEYKISILLSIQGADLFGKWGYILIIAGPPLVINYLLFLHNSRWKEIVYHFDKAYNQEKRKLNVLLAIVLSLVSCLLVLLILL